MFQFHQNNSQLLFHFIVSPRGAGAFSRGFTKILARQCRAFIRALKIEKLKAPLFPGPGGAGDAIDWCIIRIYSLSHLRKVECICLILVSSDRFPRQDTGNTKHW